jgi:peroxiredoxin
MMADGSADWAKALGLTWTYAKGMGVRSQRSRCSSTTASSRR